MRILQLAVRFPPSPGGVETHVHELSKRFVARGHEVTVLTTDLLKEVPFTRLDPILAEGSVSGVRVRRHRAHTLGGEAHYVISPGLMAAAIREGARADLIHAHSYGYFQTIAGAVASSMTGKPFVLTPHFHPRWSMEFGRRRKRLRGVFDTLVAPLVWGAADRIISVSAEEERLMELDWNVGSKIVRIPNGIDVARFAALPDAALFRGEQGLNGPFILYVGRLASNKGLHTLVAAHAMLATAGVGLVIAGEDQGLAVQLQASAERLGSAGLLRIVGHLPEGTLLSALAACELLVLPSEYEAFGIVLLEAMAAGKPVVATRVGGVPEVVDDGVEGLLVPNGDAAALSAAIDKVLSDPGTARKMGEAGRAKAGRYDWDGVARRTLEVYEEALGRRG